MFTQAIPIPWTALTALTWAWNALTALIRWWWSGDGIDGVNHVDLAVC